MSSLFHVLLPSRINRSQIDEDLKSIRHLPQYIAATSFTIPKQQELWFTDIEWNKDNAYFLNLRESGVAHWEVTVQGLTILENARWELLERQGDFIKVLVTGLITVENNEFSTVEKNPFSQIFIGSFSTQTFYEKDDFFSGNEFSNNTLIGYTSLYDRDLIPNYKLITMNAVSSLYKAFYLGSVEMVDALIDAGLNINLIEKTHNNQLSNIIKKYDHDNLIKYIEADK